MCLIVFSWQPETETPLILVANRDEFYSRPTETVHFWKDKPHILGGRDLEAGGSWLALSRNGRFAAVTNYRQLPFQPGQKSRGELVTDFLDSELSPKEFLSVVHQNASLYTGFNLLVGDSSGLYYYSNRMHTVVSLEPGVYGLSNHLLNTPWPKLERVKEGLSQKLTSQNNAPTDDLIRLMQNADPAPEHSLPDSGIGLDKEKLLSSCFIASPDYGTRNTSVLVFHKDGKLQWTEQLYEAGGIIGQRFQFSLTTSLKWQPSSKLLGQKH